ncbi:MAG: chromosome segregation ATPase [Ilumatobacter sp.]|jgi:chromosome segregation ATPase
MGLFRKKTNEPNPIDVLRAEIVDLKQRLDAADQHKAELLSMVDTVDQANSVLHQRLDSLDAASTHLDQRVGTIDQAGNEMQLRLGAVTGDVGAVRDGISTMQQQVGDVDARVGDVTQRIGAVTELSDQVHALADRLEAESKKVPPLPRPDLRITELLTRIHTLAETVIDHSGSIDDLTGSVTDHSGRINDLTGSVADHSGRINKLTDSATDHSGRINAAQAALSNADVARAEREQARTVELTAMQQRVDELAAQLADGPADPNAARAADVQVVQKQVGQMTEKMSALENRMNKVSLELANQLTELSNDLDVLLDQADAEEEPSADDAVAANELVAEAIGSVQRSTEKLAAEQARYEIQFRADLAELAELFRRPLIDGPRSTRE